MSTSVQKHPLASRCDLKNHSPSFAWGYGGSAPAQLALALLTDALNNDNLALAYYQEFKREHVAKWAEEWSITSDEIRQFVVACPKTTLPAQFDMGRIVATAGALRELPPDTVLHALNLHQTGDWGELERDDWNANNQALINGSRILSAYNAPGGERFWIITEWDRSVTTVLLPEDY